MEDAKSREELLDTLQTIITLLKPMAIVASRQIMAEIKDQFLTTAERESMYQMFDGKHSMDEIAESVGVTREAVRVLVSNLENAGLIEIIRVGRNKNPKKIID
jgi:DNA-binding transcriptional ArsR family regulator